MNFHDQLLAATEHDRGELLSIPFIQDGAAGKLQLADYVGFLTEAYHHVKHTVPLLMACGARIPERLEWLRAALVLVLEGTSTAVALHAAEALKKSLKLPPQAFSYLTSHGALDQEHTRFYATLVNKLTDADDRAALLHGAKVFYRLYGDVFRGLDVISMRNTERARKCA